MAVYNTIQRQELTDFLENNHESSYTIEEIYEIMKNDDSISKKPSKSTLYRLVRELVSDGKLRRIVKESNRECVYQYIEEESCKEHLHVKCSVCGQIYHLSEKATKAIIDNVQENDSFSVDTDTVLTGKCADCRK